MNRRFLGAWIIAAAALALPAHADIMHWYWQVEINGQAVETNRPIGVNPGDNVDIELMAEYDPYGSGFAWAVFGLETVDEFFEGGEVNISTQDGYGLNRVLRQLGWSGEFVDSKGGPAPDFIDNIEGFQLPRGFGSDFDGRNPLMVYRIGWSVQSELDRVIPLRPTSTLSGDRISKVYITDWGEANDYMNIDEVVRFVPTPGGLGVLLVASLLHMRRRERNENSGRTDS
ncbi:MAG: hypothetical protein Q9O74_02730 [Planctomycetota bacterium]|nr:hypothetical protein [Planctomycetota bacterium]